MVVLFSFGHDFPFNNHVVIIKAGHPRQDLRGTLVEGEMRRMVGERLNAIVFGLVNSIKASGKVVTAEL